MGWATVAKRRLPETLVFDPRIRLPMVLYIRIVWRNNFQEMKKKLPLPTAEMVRQIGAEWNGPWTLETFTTAFDKLRTAFAKEPIYHNIFWAIDRNLLVIEGNLMVEAELKSASSQPDAASTPVAVTGPKSVDQPATTKSDVSGQREGGTQPQLQPSVKEVAEAGIMAGMRLMAVMTGVDWPVRGQVDDDGIRALVLLEYLTDSDRHNTVIVNDAFEKWRSSNPGKKSPPISKGRVEKHFGEFVPDHVLPQEVCDELKNILKGLITAKPTDKLLLIQKGHAWVDKNAQLLGATASIVRNALGKEDGG
jgi:hypothetical protein